MTTYSRARAGRHAASSGTHDDANSHALYALGDGEDDDCELQRDFYLQGYRDGYRDAYADLALRAEHTNLPKVPEAFCNAAPTALDGPQDDVPQHRCTLDELEQQQHQQYRPQGRRRRQQSADYSTAADVDWGEV